MFCILVPVLNAILFMVRFIFNTYCFKDLKAIFIVIFSEGSYIVIENLSYIGGCDFFGVVVMLCN